MEKVTIILKDGIAIIENISFVGIRVKVIDYDNETKPVIRYYTREINGEIKEYKRKLI